MNKKTVTICLCSLLAALYVGLDYLAVTMSAPFGGTMKLSFSGIMVIIAAAYCGPIWGAATGFIGALLGQMITYGFTATTILWVLPATFRGLIFGLLFILIKKSLNPLMLLIPTLISSAVVTAVNTLVMYIDAKVYKYPVELFGIYLINRIIAAAIVSVVFALVLPPILKLTKKVIKD